MANKTPKSSSDIAKELGRRGGLATKKKYGKEHFKKLIDKRWEKERAKKKEVENEPEITS